MTTTAQFQRKPDYYDNKEDCNRSTEVNEQTNPRYKGFNQTHFTAGDESQFQQYRFPMPMSNKDIDLERNIFNDIDIPIWEKNQNISSESTLDTFRYIFNKIKKGIFVKIVNNKLKVFLPFSKANFINEWSHNIKADPKYRQYCPPKISNFNIPEEQKNLYGFLNYISTLENRPFFPNRINSNTEEWFGNNCILRFEQPLSEGEHNVSNVKNMLEELCETREVPDIELFINRRDFPIMTKDGTEPYNHLWNSLNQPLVSHNYEKYVPILSYSTTERYADYKYPTWDDWGRIKNKEGIWFDSSCNSYDHDFTTPWEEKIPTAIFRGATTGCGTTIETNPRLKVSYISVQTPPDENGIPYLDAGITKWNIRTRKIQDEEYLQTINKNELPFNLVSFKSPSEQSKYKYIIHIQGHVSAFRLSLELSMGSVILLVDSPWKMWFSDMLQPYVHYVPVNSDMSNLVEQIIWCRNNDDKCIEIVNNALEFYNTYLGKKGVLDYMQKLLVELKNNIGNVTYFETPIRIQVKQEYKYLKEKKFPDTNKTIQNINSIPQMNRCYGLLKGVEFMSNMFDANFENLPTIRNIFTNKDGNTDVNLKNLANFNFAIKTTREGSGQKEYEYIHEAFIGSKVINNLLKHIPNFAYNFGMYRNNKKVNVITEYIEGETFYDYLMGNNFNIQEFMFILIQVCLSLKVAQNRCGFVHYDLTPWNIILSRLDEPVSFDYMISYNQIYRVNTRVIPIIIDYGKSHVIYNGYHYGFINMFNSSISQDIFTLLVKSIDIVMNKDRLSKSDFHAMFTLSNFIKPFQSAKEIKNYLSKTKKYEEMISLNKYELNKDPLDLAIYIIKNNQTRFPITVVDNYNQFMNSGNPRQVFEYILSSTNQDRLLTYTNVIQRFKTCRMPQSDNIFIEYYTLQMFEKNFRSLLNDMILFSRYFRINIQDEMKIFDIVFSLIRRVYKRKIDSIKIEKIEFNIETDKIENLIKAPYTDNTFQNKTKIFELLSNYNIDNYNDFDLSDYKDIVEMVFCYRGEYELSREHYEFYLNNFKSLLESNSFNMMNNNANIKTLIAISNITYNTEIKNVDTRY